MGVGDRFCIECRRLIVPSFEYRSEKYCSKKCRTRAHNKKYKPEKYRKGTYSFVCARCGKTVTITPADKMRFKYCSETCARIARKIRDYERKQKEKDNGNIDGQTERDIAQTA